MIGQIILLIAILIGITSLLFFLVFILIPAVNRQTKITYDYFLSPIEHNYNRLKEHKEAPGEGNKMRAVVLCNANKRFSNKSAYHILNTGLSCNVVNKEFGTIGDCNYMCLGLGDCLTACPQNAISIKNNTAIISEYCVGCGECIKVCPRNVIRLVDKNVKSTVLCSNKKDSWVTCNERGKSANLASKQIKFSKIWVHLYRIIAGKVE